ncbi:Ni/Fe hydrogenase subunit alpha [Geobacter sp. AOG1]|uniref:Ni/Fe hydrogenase subunit alpha n=1 Tax=Geobacter sp. AOG1 TaxID=1566346 RepID=UPI001CC5613A|nr:Ni/Fe hydrogenase subunit alpha [Geobacter sp. AOG1]GFE59201.1 cytosolic NiFe-hydrogenase subunit alpha [Geobacter sp. AOG1]
MGNVLEIKPLSRVEGHGTVKVSIAGRQVESVQLNLIESPRLFEALLVGKPYDELPEIICRICSICSSVHRVTSLQAIEAALCIGISEPTALYRELIVAGGQIESHSLHLFCLVLPDYFDSAGFAELATKAPAEFKTGLRIKAAGNRIQELVGGRLIHPANLVPGGMGKRPARDELKRLRDELLEVLPDAVKACELFATCPTHLHPANFTPPTYLAVQSDDSESSPVKQLVTSNGQGTDITRYRELLPEQVVPHSYAKQSRAGGEIVAVGALSRLNLGIQLSSRSAQAFFDARSQLLGAPISANVLAQGVELIHSVEQSIALIDTLLDHPATCEPRAPLHIHEGIGTAALEAPRGVLIHRYELDNRGICIAADIVTPTAINQAAMERDLYALASALTGTDESELKRQLEMLVRAYDPCISCAVHVVRI